MGFSNVQVVFLFYYYLERTHLSVFQLPVRPTMSRNLRYSQPDLGSCHDELNPGVDREGRGEDLLMY